MAKLQQNKRIARNKNGDAIAVQSVAIDDSLLPSAAELEKLKSIDPSIIKWIMERTEQEQAARHKWNKCQSETITYDVKATHRFNFMALLLGFVLFVLVILAAVFCILNGLTVEGTILGGTAIITGICIFLKSSISKPRTRR